MSWLPRTAKTIRQAQRSAVFRMEVVGKITARGEHVHRASGNRLERVFVIGNDQTSHGFESRPPRISSGSGSRAKELSGFEGMLINAC